MTRIYAIIFVLILWLSSYSYSPTARATGAPLDAAYWLGEFIRLESLYRQQWSLESSPCVLLPLRNGAVLTWRDARNALPAYLDMYQWSGDPVYLDRFAERAHQILSYQQDIDGDGLPGWPGGRNGVYEESLIYDLAIAGVLARFSNVAVEHPDTALFRAVAEQMAAKWQTDWDGRQYIQSRNGTIPGVRGHAYNIQAITGLLHYELGHTEQTEAIADTLRAAMYPHSAIPGAVIWQYAPDPFAVSTSAWYQVEDINHAGSMISFAAVAMPDMLDALRLTSLGIWDGDQGFAWRIDGTEDLPPNIAPHTFHFPYYRHMELGPALYPAIEAQWRYLMRPEAIDCKAGSYLSIVALTLLHQFPQNRVWLPVAMK